MLSSNAVNAVKVFSAAVTTVVDVTTDTKVLVYSISTFNTTAAIAYLQVFDAQSGSVTLGTTAPTYVFGMPLAAGGGLSFIMLPKPILHTSGFCIAATTTRTGNTTASTNVTITYASEA